MKASRWNKNRKKKGIEESEAAQAEGQPPPPTPRKIQGKERSETSLSRVQQG
jgi:hypothetical protein